jgi:hypothetical protein
MVSVSTAGAQQQIADANRVDRYRMYVLDGNRSTLEGERVFLLDTQTGAVYRRMGGGLRWAHFTKPHVISQFPTGGDWREPEFELSLASSTDAAPRLLLTNVSSGARYTRNPDTGEWIPFRRN